MYIFYAYIHVYVCLYVSETNDGNDTRDRKEELRLFCYYNVFKLPIRWYSYLKVNLDWL